MIWLAMLLQAVPDPGSALKEYGWQGALLMIAAGAARALLKVADRIATRIDVSMSRQEEASKAHVEHMIRVEEKTATRQDRLELLLDRVIDNQTAHEVADVTRHQAVLDRVSTEATDTRHSLRDLLTGPLLRSQLAARREAAKKRADEPRAKTGGV